MATAKFFARPVLASLHVGDVRCWQRAPKVRIHQWRKNPAGELSIDPVADKRLVRVTAWVGAS
jgi:hypothetical protein